MASWQIHRQGDRLTINLDGQPSERETGVLLEDLEPRLADSIAEVVLDGPAAEAGIGPHLPFHRIKRIGQVVGSHGKAFTVRPI